MQIKELPYQNYYKVRGQELWLRLLKELTKRKQSKERYLKLKMNMITIKIRIPGIKEILVETMNLRISS